MKVFTLPYGKGKIEIELSEQNFTLLKPQASPPALAKEHLIEAINNPVSSAPLKKLLSHNDKILVVISDITRTTSVKVLLPLILDEIKKAGVSEKNIKLIIAIGNHRSLQQDEIKKILGNEVASNFEIVQHNSKDSTNLKYMGKTSRGTEVYLNQLLLEMDKVILTGAITHHYFAGFAGGRKSLVPGLSGLATIVNNHKLCIDFEAKKVRNGIEPGNLDSNPLNLDLEEAVSLLPPSFIVNSIVNDKGEIIKLFSGHWQKAHRQGCNYYHQLKAIPIKDQRNLAIVSCGGYPKDINLIQSHKTLQYSSRCLKSGGYLILLAECSDGIGSPDFLNWFPIYSMETFLNNLKDSLELNGQTAFFMHCLASHYNIILVSSIKPELLEPIGIRTVATLNEALGLIDAAVIEEGGYIIPEGSSTLPIISM
jgi:nickel-dependent lactate racemase